MAAAPPDVARRWIAAVNAGDADHRRALHSGEIVLTEDGLREAFTATGLTEADEVA